MAARFVGLDIGHLSVRAVVLRQSGKRWQVRGFASVQRRDAGSGELRPLPQVLRELDRAVGIRRGTVVVGASDLTALVRFVSTTPMPPDRLARLLRLELSQHADPGGELAADTFAVPLAGDELIHCCVLAQPAQVYALLADLKAAGITPERIHYPAAAVYNATLLESPVMDDDLALVVDIGTRSTRVALFGDRRLLACRQLSAGGEIFTEALAKSRDLHHDRAEALKLQGASPAAAKSARSEPSRAEAPSAPASASAALFAPGLQAGPAAATVAIATAASDELVLEEVPDALPLASEPAAPPVSASGIIKNEFDQFFAAVEDAPVVRPGNATVAMAVQTLGPELTKAAESLYTQIASSLAWFKAQLKVGKLEVKRVLLSGGGADLAGLPAYLERRFAVPVAVANPFAGMEGLQPDRPHHYLTATGLALSRLNGAVRFDLLPEKIERQRLWTQRLIWPYIAAVACIAATLITVWTWLGEQSVHRASLAAFDEYKQQYDMLKKELDRLEQEKADLSEDLRAVASRVYAGRDLLYTVRALKEQSPKSPELWVVRLATVGVGKDNKDAKESPAGTAPEGGGRLGTGGGRIPGATSAEGHRDTAIQRGGVDISGLVKFESAPTDPQLNEFFKNYMKEVETWQAGKNAPPLFDASKTRVLKHVILPPEEKAKNKEGHFPFTVRFVFQPTQLDQVTITTVGKSEGAP